MDYLLQNGSIFKNPNRLPLNELNLEIKCCKKKKKVDKNQDLEKLKDNLNKNYDVYVEKRPALHKSWLQQRTYVFFQPYYTDVPPEENVEFGKNSQYIACLDFLLQCTYQQFWCYVIHDPQVKIMLESFLVDALDWYELKELKRDHLEMYEDIYFKVAQIYGRMLTYKETEMEYMSESTVHKLLKEQQLLSFFTVLQIIWVYKYSNDNLVKDVIKFYFADNNKKTYETKLDDFVNYTRSVLETIGGVICGFDGKDILIQLSIGPKPSVFDPTWYEEMINYIMHTVGYFKSLMTVCDPAIVHSLKAGIPYRLTYFYNRVFPTIYRLVEKSGSAKEKLTDRINLASSEILSCFHVYVTHLTDEILQCQQNPMKQDAYMEQLLQLLSATLEDDFFVIDYHNSYPIDEQLQIISSFYPELDTMRSDYILECLSTLPTLNDIRAKLKEKTPPVSKNVTIKEERATTSSHEEKLSETEIEQRIASVLDMLPDLGDEFILRCLEFYNYDSMEVISAILDDNLSPNLQDLPRDMIRVPPEPKPEQPILAYRGKKPTYHDAKDMLNDKSNLKEIRDFVLKSSNVTYDMYDDEYDDRDDVEGVRTLVNEEDKYMENRFEGYDLVSDPSSSEDEETPKPNKNFCEDPALIRERREAARRQTASRGRRGGDVVGKAKGQGQDKSVVQNRDKKNTNKSSRANHNRKGGAQFKRNKGMIPS
ncbi:PREDICTED: activating signal cointegrator 1 complex subunit 2 [Nicrophorus vespilloides]|uniref:Activating signal cointegrator 1 complex subunit 2 n=1 Tax=Nicrophorus vespilloides TaxID=110193 RepID=A0ABM1N0R2_NICVS|nr:PREDICTED: activating signal cointegrator 1 complex subunit 2 [Nicrophorus vespilloides]